MLNPTWIYVAAVYFAAIWLARRARVEIPWKIAVFFYVLVLVYMFQPLTRDVANLPVDFVKTLPPWVYNGNTVTAANRDLNDVVLQIAPWAHQVREAWKAGDAPLWNAMSGSGYPLMASSQASAFSPLRILSLPLPLAFAFAAEAAWKILTALTFVWLLCRRRGYSEFASAAGAIAFGFSSFIIVWLHFPLITSASLLPAVLYGFVLLAERVTWGRFAFTAFAWTFMLFGGHPETASHTFFIVALFSAWVLFVERPFKTRREAMKFVFAIGGSGVVAALMALPYLLPLAEAITRSKRFEELKMAPNAFGYYSDWLSTIAWLQPRFFGALPMERPWGPATAESITGFSGVLAFGACFAMAAWVIRYRKWRSREAFFVVMTILLLWLVFAWPGISELFHLVFRLAANARLRLLICLVSAVQLAAVIDLVERGHIREFLFGVLAIATVLLVAVTTTDFPIPLFLHTAVAAVIPSVAVLLAATIAVLLPRWRQVALLVTVTLMVAELWTATDGWNPVVPSALMYPKAPMIDALVRLRDEDPAKTPFRIVGTGAYFFPNTSAIYGFEDIRAHDPMASGRYLGMLRVIAGYDTSKYFGWWTSTDSRLLDFLNVRYILGPPNLAMTDMQRFELVYDGKDGRIFRNFDALPRWYPIRNVVMDFDVASFNNRLRNHQDWAHTAYLDELEVTSKKMANDLLQARPADAPEPTIEMRRQKPADWEMTVDAPRHSLIGSSIPWWPGWTVLVAGEPVNAVRINGGFLGFVAPPGTTDVRIVYRPMSFTIGAWIAGLTLLSVISYQLRVISYRLPVIRKRGTDSFSSHQSSVISCQESRPDNFSSHQLSVTSYQEARHFSSYQSSVISYQERAS